MNGKKRAVARRRAGTILELFQSFMDTWKRNCERSTIDSRRHALRRWERHSSNPPASRITTELIIRFRENALAAGLGEETIENTVKCVFLVLREAVRRKLLRAVPEKPRRIRGALRRRSPPSLADFDRFCRSSIELEERGELPCPERTNWFRTLLAVAYFTALRRSDLIERLAWNDVGADAITVRAKKTGKVQTLPMHPVLMAVLNEYRQWVDGARVFPVSRETVKRALDAVAKATGIAGVCLQSIRKVSARQYERAHAGAGALVLGHSLPGATAFYLDVPEILREASAKLAVPGAFYEGLENPPPAPDPCERIERAALLQAIDRLPPESVQALLKLCSPGAASGAGGMAGK